MRIRIAHDTRYHYEVPPKGVIQTLRLTPRNFEGQYVSDWRLDVSTNCRLDRQEDAFGNIAHAFTADGPLSDLSVSVEGEVETRDTGGVVRDAIERFPPSLYLRETALTQPDAAIREFAQDVSNSAGSNPLEILHGLLTGLNREMTFDPSPTQTTTTAREAFALRRGVCQDLTHIFIAAARTLGIPARYIGGYYQRDDLPTQDAGHAWAEGFVPNLGWVAFDPTHGVCPGEKHVRVAAALDYLGAAPVRGTRYGGSAETLDVKIEIAQAAFQAQS
jgi:transglutaminase-like putative cysteine protease